VPAAHYVQVAAELTPREQQIANAIADGLSNRDIAHRYGISERTVKNQLTVIYEKLHVSSRLQLAMLLISSRAQR
jgi:DNA-binding NarL/FixJ family response regulator